MGRTKREGLRVVVPRPDRVRTLEGTAFGWLDARLWTERWLEGMTAEDVAIYVFLALVADRHGVSWWRRDRMARSLGLYVDDVDRALARLIALDLVAYRPFGPHAADGFHQLLGIPPGGPPASELPGQADGAA
jgi:hypothetical protein